MKSMVAVVDGPVVRVSWPNGHSSSLPCLWLRDNCGCRECRVEQTAEKRFMISQVPVDLQPESVSCRNGCLEIRWPDGHVSAFHESDIQALTAQRRDKWIEWGAGYEPCRTDYEDFLQDDDVAASMLRDFLEHGAAILINAPKQAGTLEQLAPRLGPIREVLFARIHDVSVDPDGYNVAHTAMTLPPHNDFASYSWPPSVQALHMLINESSGGESFIVDGWKVLRDLRKEQPELFDSLCAMPVPFREFDADNETYAVEPIVRTGINGEIRGLRFSNQLMQAVDPERQGVATFYRAYHELCRRLTEPSEKATFRLDGGEILIVAAHRVLHGRHAFDAAGRRHLQDAYFELDNMRNHLVVLERRENASND